MKTDEEKSWKEAYEGRQRKIKDLLHEIKALKKLHALEIAKKDAEIEELKEQIKFAYQY